VGLEDIKDIKEDFDRALKMARKSVMSKGA